MTISYLIHNDDIYEVGHLGRCSDMDESQKVLANFGRGIVFVKDLISPFCYRSALNPLPPDHPIALKLKLGGEVLASMPEECRDRVVAYRKVKKGEEFFIHGSPIRKATRPSDHPWPILAPEPDPPKTDREMLEELTFVAKTSAKRDAALMELVDSAERHLSENG